MATERIIPPQEMGKLLGKSPKTLWRWWAKDRSFPAPIRQNGRAIGWPESAYRGWLAERAAA
jgi:prophage regulatory protein